MRIAYFDCFSGITGDMALASLVHAGADLSALSETLRTFPVEEFLIEPEEEEVHGIASLRIHIRARPQGVIHTYASIRAMLENVDLPARPRWMAHRIYRRLAEAAASVHGKEMELVTFHEFGDLDCIVEIVGCALALDMLGVDRVFASAIPTGLGMIRTEHGMSPIPSPVVVELLRGAPTYSRGIPVELVTPTGAAILATVSEGYGEMPLMRADHVGYGAGHLRLDFPNVLRVVVGEEQRAGAGSADAMLGGPVAAAAMAGLHDVLVESWLGADDPRLELLLSALLRAGAVDAWSTAARGPGGEDRCMVSAVGPASARATLIGAMVSVAPADRIRVSPVARPEESPPPADPIDRPGGPSPGPATPA